MSVRLCCVSVVGLCHILCSVHVTAFSLGKGEGGFQARCRSYILHAFGLTKTSNSSDDLQGNSRSS